MVNVSVFAPPPGQRPVASITRTPSLLLVWPKVPAVKVLPGLPLEDVKLAPEKTSDWSATASRASTTSVRKAFFTFVPGAPLWLTWRSFRRIGGGPQAAVRPRRRSLSGRSVDRAVGDRRPVEAIGAGLAHEGGVGGVAGQGVVRPRDGESVRVAAGRAGRLPDEEVLSTHRAELAGVDRRRAFLDQQIEPRAEVVGVGGGGLGEGELAGHIAGVRDVDGPAPDVSGTHLRSADEDGARDVVAHGEITGGEHVAGVRRLRCEVRARTDHDAGGQEQHRQGQQHLHAPLTKEKLHALHFSSICASLAHLSRSPGLPVSRRPSLECHVCSVPRGRSDARPGTLPDRFRLVLPHIPCPSAALWPWDKCLAETGTVSPG